MRKISSILTLLLLCLCGNLSAQELTRLTTIANGDYYLGCPANGEYAYYDGTNQYLRRTASPEANGKFTITQGTSEDVGYYTIQTNDGKYVVAGTSLSYSNVPGVNVKVVESTEATDDNKWWAFTVDASNASWVDIFPKQQSYTQDTPAWNFAATFGDNANKVVGLFEAKDNNSNWLLLPNNPNRVISMNFGNQGSGLFTDGINKLPPAAWNNVVTAKNNRDNLVTWDGTAAATLSPNWSVTWSSKEMYQYTTSVKENILKGYLDDGEHDNGKYATVTFTNLPFTTGYDLYIYSATDNNNVKFRPISVTMNGHTYTYTTESGVGYFGTSNWGQSRNATSVMGTNVICIKGLTASEITISGGQSAGGARGGIAAVQIVETAGQSNVINVMGNTFDASGVTSPVYLVKDGDLTIQNVTPEIRSKYIDVTGVTGTVTWEGYKDITYRLTDANGATYEGVYNTYWDGSSTELPSLNGAEGLTITNANFSTDGETYTLTANITFPFPVSSNGAKNATGIQSQLGTSKWFKARDFDGYYVTASSEATSKIREDKPEYHKWYIYPTLTDGTFSFKIENADGGYIRQLNNSQNPNTKNYLVEEASAGVYYFTPCVGAGKSGFSIDSEGTKFLTVNTSGTDQPIWVWTKTGAHQGSNLSFYTPVANYTKADAVTDITPYKGLSKFDGIDATYEVVGPNEIGNPLVINAAIDAANALNLESDEATIFAFLDSDELLELKRYKSALETYNTPVTTKFEMKGTYGTLIIACGADRPAGLKFYTCATVNGTALELVEHEGALNDKTPYIVEQIAGAAHNKYAIIGWNRLANTDPTTYTIGRLTGVLTAGGATVPNGGYILALKKSEGTQAFFLTDGNVTCPQYKCYLTLGGGATAPKELYFDNEGTTTGIEAIFGGENEEVVIYDLSGKRLNRLQKGVNIVNGHKVIVK